MSNALVPNPRSNHSSGKPPVVIHITSTHSRNWKNKVWDAVKAFGLFIWRFRKTIMRTILALIAVAVLIGVGYLVYQLGSTAIALVKGYWLKLTGFSSGYGLRGWLKLVIALIILLFAFRFFHRGLRGRFTTPTPSVIWTATTEFWKKHWVGGSIIPVVLFLIVIHMYLMVLFPTWVWEPLTRDVPSLILTYAVFALAVSAIGKAGKVWKGRLIILTMLLCVVYITTSKLGWTPALGEAYWIQRNIEAKLEYERNFQLKLLPRDPNAEVIVAPVGKRSERIPFADGPRIDIDDSEKIFVWDDKNRRVPMQKDDHLTFAPTDWIQVQSGTGKEVKVYISR